jgi:3-deoxy-D-manno-octulosonic-acid transferase
MKKFAKSVKPIALVLGENELWPGYLSTMKRLCLKPSVAIVSGRFHAAIPGIDFSPIGFAGMQTGADLSRFMNVASRANIGSPIIGGDWKLLPWARKGDPVKPAENPTVDVAFVSMHFSEWAALYRMADTAIAGGEAVVLAPRRLEEVPAFRKAFSEKKIPTVEWPQVQKGAVSIVDKFGLTKDIFAISKAAIVGGSFNRTLGVHDFWEPLQAGVATYVGPYSAGQAENVAALVREGVISQLRSPEEFSRKVIPDPKNVEKFLSREKEKIEDSYRLFVDFVLGLLPTPNVKQP